MTKIFLIVLAIPACIIMANSVCAINCMSVYTKDTIRWSNILIALGAGIEIMALIAAYSVEYGSWVSIKMMFAGAIMMNFGFAGLYFAERRVRIDNGYKQTNI